MIIDPTITNKRAIVVFSNLENRFKVLHGEKFSYNKAVYKGYLHPIIITCMIHGDFKQSPATHLKGLPHNCPKCVSEASIKRQSGNKEEFVTKALVKHNGCYTYDNFTYITARIPSYITCKVHGDFKQSADNHVRGGNGCPHCGSRLIKDKSKQQVCRLYLLYLPEYNLYKIGITTKSIDERMHNSNSISYSILVDYIFENTIKAYKIEQIILSRMKLVRYNGIKVLVSGNTELLAVNPIKLVQRLIKRYKKKK